jgi:hypothetical protein
MAPTVSALVRRIIPATDIMPSRATKFGIPPVPAASLVRPGKGSLHALAFLAGAHHEAGAQVSLGRYTIFDQNGESGREQHIK